MDLKSREICRREQKEIGRDLVGDVPELLAGGRVALLARVIGASLHRRRAKRRDADVVDEPYRAGCADQGRRHPARDRRRHSQRHGDVAEQDVDVNVLAAGRRQRRADQRHPEREPRGESAQATDEHEHGSVLEPVEEVPRPVHAGVRQEATGQGADEDGDPDSDPVNPRALPARRPVDGDPEEGRAEHLTTDDPGGVASGEEVAREALERHPESQRDNLGEEDRRTETTLHGLPRSSRGAQAAPPTICLEPGPQPFCLFCGRMSAATTAARRPYATSTDKGYRQVQRSYQTSRARRPSPGAA